MAFLNVSLLLGGLLTAIPIALHLVMRQQPKRLTFPAMQFLRQRRETNRRKLQLKHWLLLAMRCAAIVLLALAFARPSVLSNAAGQWMLMLVIGVGVVLAGGVTAVSMIQRKGKVLVGALAGVTLASVIAFAVMIVGLLNRGSTVLLGDEQAPIAAALIFDTSPHMEYRYQNESRTEVAQSMGNWLISQLPADSEVAVLDSRRSPAMFAVDLASARKAIDRLRTTEVSEPLSGVAARALELVVGSEKTRKEIYLFTDLVDSAWQDRAGALSKLLQEHDDVLVYVIDVGVVAPVNVGLGPLDLSTETLAKSSELRVSTRVQSLGVAGNEVVQLLIEDFDPTLPVVINGETKLPEARPRGRQEITVAAGESQFVEFRVRGLEPGVHHGVVQLLGDDGLDADNLRHFTIEVKDAWPMLVVASSNAATSLFTEAIAPFEFEQTGQARFACTVVPQSSLANRDLDSFTGVCLLDPDPIPSVTWEQLAKYVRSGGGVAVFLGHNAQATASFNEPAAQQLLGGRLARVWRSPDRSLFLAPERYDHPVMAPFRERSTSVPWSASPVFKHWVLDPIHKDADTILAYSNGKPAVVERSVDRGRVVTMTTPVSDPIRPVDHSAWNELPTSDEAWPYVVLVNELMLHLTDSSGVRLNYVAGEPGALPNDSRMNPERYQLFSPSEQPQEARAQDGEVVVRFTEHPGVYRLKGVKDGPVVRGFSVNLPPEATDLTRVSIDELDAKIGKGRYQLARDKDEIALEVGEARVGREFYSHLLVLLVVVLGIEHLMANRFYRKPE
ncbi:MAG: BatA domain-containing protein [Planctomycetaceae bacterium]|nr:BatA domain-containing protein [Planctomycetales bacterium]MCB9925815.1 BatA domain-containing protein [Planctomycetaceae bacterium]